MSAPLIQLETSEGKIGITPDWQKTLLQEVAAEMTFTPDLALALFNNNPDATVVVDREGKIILINLQAEFLTGYHRSELKGREVEMLIPEGVRERHVSHRSLFIDEPRSRPMGIGLDLRVLRKDGREVEVDINLAPVSTPRGMYVIAVIRKKR